MPYIKKVFRDSLDSHLTKLSEEIINKGDYTYCIYKLASLILKIKGINYDNLSALRSSMDDASFEWYRRKMITYEDQKIIENGDIDE